MNTIAFTKVKLPYGWLSNMSPYPIEYEGTIYRTTEALFQCLRFRGHPEVQKKIREQKSPMAAKMIAKKHRHLLQRGEDWDEAEDDIERMRLCLKLKLQQHPQLRQQLLVICQVCICGYKRLRRMRASAVVNCQSTPFCASLRC